MISVGRPRVLVVEDEVIIARGIALNLKKAGYDVIDIVDSGEAAIHKAKAEHPDLVLMDIVLQGDIDGIQAAEQIRHFNIPVVFLTAYADSETLKRAKQTSPFGYILKPIRNNDFHSTIQMALQKAADLAKLLQDKSDLLQEVEHRVFNNLQVLSSLLLLKTKEFDEPQVRTALRESQSWVTVMVIANRHAFSAEQVGRLKLYTYLSDLTQQVINFMACQADISIEAPVALQAITLSLNQAVYCGLAVNEIIANLLPVGESDSPPPKLTLALEQTNLHSLTITIVSDVVGHATPTVSALPSRLLALMVEQLEASLESQQTKRSRGFSMTIPLKAQLVYPSP